MSQKTKQYRDGRIVLSLNDWKKLRSWVWWFYETVYGEVRCHLHGCKIYEFMYMQLDHQTPRGLGGGTRDDRFVLPICPAHNYQKGSQRIVSPRLDLPEDVRRWRLQG